MRFARIASIAALVFLGLSAIAGAVPMIVGSLRNTEGFMPLSLLRNSPFHSYLIPGIILLASNGLLALWILWQVYRRSDHHGMWTAFQGCVLFGWLVVECWMLQVINWLHYLYGAIAVVLMVSGLVLRHAQGAELIHRQPERRSR